MACSGQAMFRPLVALFFLGAEYLWLSYQDPTAPAPEGLVPDRHAWGDSYLGSRYRNAGEQVNFSPLLREDVGTVTGVAPLGVPNFIATTDDGEKGATLRLEVTGAGGRGIHRVGHLARTPSGDWCARSLTWSSGGRSRTLSIGALEEFPLERLMRDAILPRPSRYLARNLEGSLSKSTDVEGKRCEERHVGRRHLQLLQVRARGPCDRVVLDRSQRAGHPLDAIGQEFHGELRIPVHAPPQELSDANLYPEFLIEFTSQACFRTLTRFDLAPRELPQAGLTLARSTTGYQYRPVANDDGSGDADRPHLGS